MIFIEDVLYFPMIFPFYHDFPMIFPWISHDFPMMFPWFSHFQLTFSSRERPRELRPSGARRSFCSCSARSSGAHFAKKLSLETAWRVRNTSYISVTMMCIYICVCVSIYLSIDLSIYLSIDRSIYRSIYLSIYRSIYLSIDRSIDLSIYRSIYLSIDRSIYLSIYNDHPIYIIPS